MRNPVVATLALTAALHAGCFTAVGAGIGALAASGSRPPPRPSPIEVTGAPGATALAFSASRDARRVDHGMSPVAKGALIGAAIDTVITVAVLAVMSQLDDDLGCIAGGCE